MKPLTLLLAALVLVAGCAGGTKRDEVDRNDADIAFVREMIPHHQDAVEMAALVDDAGASPEVVALAEQIEAAQQPEITRMTGWLDDWDVDRSAHSMEEMPSGGGLDELEQATGEAFDRAWLTMMITHHEGAVEMARTEIAEGENPEAIELAESIISSQSDEITTMKELLP